jgi:hypothetical protein
MRVTGAAFVGTLGILLGGGIVVSKLRGATYARDVATLCNAESASGFSLGKNAARVTTWAQEHLQTSEGGRLLGSLRDLPLAERAKWLERESRGVGLSTCPMVTAYDELDGRWRAKQELQHLCSITTFPDLDKLDVPERLQLLEEWLTLYASTAEARRLESRLGRAETADVGAELLRDAANDSGILTCDIAKTLAVPVAQSCGP